MGTLLAQVLPEDLHKFGLIPEFVGRIPVLANVTELSEQDLMRILTEPKNALVKQYQRLFALEGIELDFTADALKEVAAQAIKRGTGARGLRSILEGMLLDYMYDLPGRTDVERVTITLETARGEAPALLTLTEAEATPEVRDASA
jgi:ATP-dependent Clp protease ATP-binding subunit ClpX